MCDRPFTFEIEYETMPPIVWTRPYKEAEVTLNDTGNIATDSAAVEDLIRQFLKQKGFQRVVVSGREGGREGIGRQRKEGGGLILHEWV